MTNDLYLTQERLELESKDLTLHRFNTQLTDNIQRGEETATYYGATLMKRAIEPMIDGIVSVIEEAKSGKAGPKMAAVRFFKLIEHKVLAYLTCKTIITRISGKNRLQDVAINIGQALEDEQRWASFEEQKPFLFKKLLNEIDTTEARKRANLVSAYNRYCDEWVSWSKQDKLHLGMKLIEIFIAKTGFAEIITRSHDKNKTDLHLNKSSVSYYVQVTIGNLNLSIERSNQ